MRRFNTAAFRDLDLPDFRIPSDQTVCRAEKTVDQPKMEQTAKKKKTPIPGKENQRFLRPDLCGLFLSYSS